jgi:lipopolysaccharide/colanic/teichoic acid biosynthesis glycosyltransferase
LAIKWDDQGPVFYLQRRIGKNFRPFALIKFRTMVVGADKTGLLTSAHDDRITRVGRFLRRYKFDELPQLINVLKGDMQFVGPRPEVERYVEMFRPQYAILLEEKPGITDPASLAYRHEERALAATSDVSERIYISQVLPHKIRLSTEYQQCRTAYSDLRVVLQTILGV